MGKLAGILVVLTAFILGWAGAPAAAAERSATLRLINPEIFLKGMRIKHIVATLDGVSFGECWADRRQADNLCIKPQPIDPGPHILELVLDPLATTYFRSVDKFTAGMSGDWTFDVKGLVVDDAKTDDYLTLSQDLRAVGVCRAALERLASLSSCTTDEFRALGPIYAEALDHCAKDIPEDEKDAVAAALDALVDTHFGLEIARCYTRTDIEKLPERLTAFIQPDRGWPLQRGSWRWARGEAPDLSDSRSLAAALEKLQAPLLALAKRVAVVDEVIQVYLGGDKAAPIRAAMSAPWSLDAETPDGHRNWLLLGDRSRFYSDDYADFVAEKVAADSALDCARSESEATTLVGFFTETGSLRPPAFDALLAMARRVPGDLDFGACGRAIDLSLDSPIAPADRLRRFFALDCAETRAGERRGEAVKAFLEGNSRVDIAIRKRMREEFAQCLGASRQLAAAAATSSALAEAAKRGCKIEPNAACSHVTLSRTDLHGADLHGAKLDEATLEEAVLNGANLAGADLHGAILDKADLTGVDLTGANLDNLYARRTDLHGAKFAGARSMRRANLRDSDLHGADLAGVALGEALLEGVNFEGANLKDADLSGAKITKAKFRNSDLRHAKLDGASLKEADLTGAKLEGASLREVTLMGAILRDAVLAGADLGKSPLEGVTWVTGCKLGSGGKCAGVDLHGLSLSRADLQGIDLSGANLAGADLSFASLEGADLHGADLRGANVQQTIFRRANLARANLEGSEGGSPQFDGADMSEAILRDGKKCAPGAKADRLHDC